MPKLEVPLWGQPSRNYCVPACIKMILEFLRKVYGDDIPRLNISSIARIVRTQWDGTAPKNVELMNQYFEARVCVKFKAKAMMRFPDIIKELDEHKPVIVWLNVAKNSTDNLWHSIVVTDFDPKTNYFTFNDPWDTKEKTEEAGKFLQKWGTEAKMVKLLISTNEQTYLGKWLRENQLKGEPTNE
jgi:hypothetical protein